jgi:hypothetical protein
MVHQGEWPLKEKRVIEHVEYHDKERGTTSQSVQHFEVLFSATGAVQSCGGIHHSVAPRRTVCTALSRVLQRQDQTLSSRHGGVAQVSETSANHKTRK